MPVLAGVWNQMHLHFYASLLLQISFTHFANELFWMVYCARIALTTAIPIAPITRHRGETIILIVATLCQPLLQ